MTPNAPSPDAASSSLSEIAHRLRTPLTVIMSTVNNFLDGAYGALAPDQSKWMKKLTTHTSNLEELLNRLLDILRAQPEDREALKMSLSHVPLSPSVLAPVSVPSLGSGRPGAMTGPPALILIVDDEPDIRDTVQEGLESKGFRCVTASTGEEAVAAALTQRPDLILMDVLLERQNGIEICRQIKSQVPMFTPVILVTGQNDLREKIAGSNHDADDLLTKPFQMEELFARVTSMLRLKKLERELAAMKGAAGGADDLF